jgi:AcrR family transcriptional regulator
MSQRLSKQEWIDAALRALAEHGVDGVRVERLAGALKVTKGSFYWHFKDRPALLAEVLDTWKARSTRDVITMVDGLGGDARARLLLLGTTVFSSDGRLDRQVRAWAAVDPAAQLARNMIDEQRVAYVEELFSALGFSSDSAKARALFVYHALIGQFELGHRGPSATELGSIVDALSNPRAEAH